MFCRRVDPIPITLGGSFAAYKGAKSKVGFSFPSLHLKRTWVTQKKLMSLLLGTVHVRYAFIILNRCCSGGPAGAVDARDMCQLATDYFRQDVSSPDGSHTQTPTSRLCSSKVYLLKDVSELTAQYKPQAVPTTAMIPGFTGRPL